MAITKKKILKTALLPGIFPRLKNLFGSGFATLAYLVAVVYNTVRILPNNHPFLKSENIGHYSVRQVIAEAANHIKPDKKNIDQIIIFSSVIAALGSMLLQFVLLVIAMVISKAQAQVTMPAEIKEFSSCDIISKPKVFNISLTFSISFNFLFFTVSSC